MGIYCEINLHTPGGNIVGAAGNIVSGIIKYAVDEETIFTKIIVSLKGFGNICLQGVNYRTILEESEKYIDIDQVIENKESDAITPVGTYEIPFRFEFRHNLPPSVKYDKNGSQCRVSCRIKYYIRIKFIRQGIVNFTKRFKKPINMRSTILPRLPKTLTIYGGDKKLTQIFTFNSSNINIKAGIINSVLKCGDTIEFYYELNNNSKLTINGVEIKLVEAHSFYARPDKAFVTEYDDIQGTVSKTCAIKSGDTQNMSFSINIPLNRSSAEFSKIYSRDYYVFISALLPLPHRNHVLKIPVQVDDILKDDVVNYEMTGSHSRTSENPPSYWESMNEYKSDKI